MIRHMQRFRHDPAKGQYGDCHRTAIACLLDLDPESVPHFYEEKVQAEARGENYHWRDEVERFLNTRGFTAVDITFGCDLPELFRFMETWNPQTLYLLGGSSPRRFNHTVICCGGGFEWDPHPDAEFVDSPLDSGYFEITFLLPISMKQDKDVGADAQRAEG